MVQLYDNIGIICVHPLKMKIVFFEGRIFINAFPLKGRKRMYTVMLWLYVTIQLTT